MNKIFKVIWSKSKQCYVVVSELAKNTTGKKKIVVASILATLAMTGNTVQVEAVNGNGSRAGFNHAASGVRFVSNLGDGNNGLAIGPGDFAGKDSINNTVALGNTATVAIGLHSNAKKSSAVAIGGAIVDGGSAVGLGWTHATGAGAVAIGGDETSSNGVGSVAIGNSHATGDNSFAVSGGTADGKNAFAAVGGKASADGSIAVGKDTKASNSDAVSIGTSSQATGSDSLALGKNAKAKDSDSIAIGQDAVADSINGVALGKTSKATGSSATALGPQSTASGTYSTAIGMNSVANKEYAIAIGGSSQATVERGVALGTYSIADTASGVSGYDANTNRTNKYAGLTGKALTSTWGAVSIGDSTNTRQITGLAAGTKDTDAVNVAQLKSVNLAFTGDNSSSGDVNLANSKLAVTGDTTYITITAASQGIAIKGVKKDITVSNGTASAIAGMADAKNVAEAINKANADQTITYKANGGTTNSVKLSDGLNFTNGTSTVATVGNNGQVTYDLNAATKKSITDSEAAVKRTISLGADSGTRSSQSLNNNNVDFNVKGSSGSYITTSMAGNTVNINTTKGTIQSDAAGTATLSGADGLATAQNVATAINKAKEGSAWNLAVNTGAAQKVAGGTKVTLQNGKNIALTQTGTTITVGTTNQLTADAVTVGSGANQIVLNGTTGEVSGKSIKTGNSTLNTNGLTISGGPSVTSTGINAGNKVISGVSQAVAGTDAVNKSQMDAAVKTVADFTSELGKNTITLAAQSGSTTGQALNSATGIKFYINGESGSDALISTSASGTNVSVAATQKLKDAVTQAANAANKDLSNLSTAGDTHIKDLAKTAATWNVSTNGSNNTAVTGGETVNFINGDNVSVTNTGRNITIGTAKNVSFDKVTVGGIVLDKTNGINAGGKEIKGIAKGTTDDAAVNKKQMDDALAGISSILTINDGTTDGSVNLKAGKLKIVGESGANALVTTTVSGDTISVGTSTKLQNAVTAAENSANKDLSNLSTTGSNTVKTLAQDAVEVAGTGLATVSNSTDASGNKTYTVNVDEGKLVIDDSTGKLGATGATQGATQGKNGVATTQDVASVVNSAIDKTTKALTDATHDFGGDVGTKVTRKHGEQLDVKGGVTNVSDLTTNNIGVVTDPTNGALNIRLAKALTGLTSATYTDAAGNTQTVTGGSSTISDAAGNSTIVSKGGVTTTDAAGNTTTTAPTGVTVTPAGTGTTPISITTSGISAGNKEIKNVANGTTDDAAVNKKQMDDALKGATDNTVSLGSESGSTTAKKLSTTGGITFNIKGETGANALITTSATGDDVTVAPTAKLTAAVTAAENAANKDLSNLNAAGDTYIKNLAKSAASWNVETNGAGTTAVAGGETVNFINGDNIAITNTGRNITIGTAKNVSFDKVTVGGVTIDKTDGINAGGKEIKGIADGTAADSAVSKSQMENAIATAQTAATSTEKVVAKTLTGDTNLVTVTGQTGTAKGETYEVAVSENAVKTVAQAAAKDAVKVAGTGLATVSDATAAGVKTYTVNVDEGKLVIDDTTGKLGATGATQGATQGKDGVATTQDVASVVNSAIDKTKQALDDAKHNFAGDDATVISRKHGEQLNIKGGASTTATDLTSGNIAVVGDATSGTLNIKLAKVLTGLTSATYTDSAGNTQTVTGGSSTITDGAGNTTTITKGGVTTTDGTNTTTVAPSGITATDGTHTVTLGGSGINAGGAEIKNIGKATTDDAAVNKKQMDDAVKAATDSVSTLGDNKVSLGTDAGTTNAKKLSTTGGITFNIKGETGANALITTSATGDDVTIAPTAKLTAAVTAAENAANKDLSNLNAAGDTYIKNLAKTAASWNVETNGAGTTAVAGGETVNFINGDNIAITNTGRNITIGTAKNVSFDKVTVGGVTIDKTDGINAGGKAISNVGTGRVSNSSTDDGNVANIGDVKAIANDAVSNLSTSLGVTDGTNSGTVNLKNQSLKVVGTGVAKATVNGQTITVDVAEGTFTNKSDGTTTATAGVAKADDVAAAINNANTVLGNKITAATQSLSTLGDNKFKLTADSTSTTGQALNKSGGLSFKIAGDGGLVSTSATTDTINVTVKKGALTNAADGSLNVTDSGVVTADNMKSVVNDAITKAVTSAKDGSAWNISTNGGTATKVSGGNTVDLNGGDNIEITQDPTDGKKITVKTKKDLTLDSVTAANTVKVGSGTNLITLDGTTGGVSGNSFTAGNASMNTTGFRVTGGPSITTAGIDAGGKQITNMISGGTVATNAATIGDVNTKVTTAINDLTTNLTKNTNIAYTANTATPGQTVSLKDGFNFTNGTLTTAEVAAGGVVKFNVTQGSLSTDANGNITNTAGVATTDDVKNAVSTAINTAVTKATGAQVLNITDGTNNDSINLKNDTLKVVGADGVTTEVSGKTITVGLDTATKNKINNASTAANRNISLAADSGTTSSQSLKDGDVSFAVKGATGDYISTNMNGSTVEISTKRATINSNAATGEASVTGNDGLATAKNVADAINAATAKAVSQSAWKLAADGTTGTETISGGDTVNFKAGSNMEVSRTGKDITYKTKDNVAFTTVTAGTGANEVKLDGNTGTVTAKDITATGDVTAKNVTTSGNVTAAGTVKGDTVQGNTVKAGNVTITGGTTNTITGLSNTSWNGTTTTPDRAATEGQLQQAISSAASSATFKFDGDNNSQQTMNLQNGTFKVTGDTMITTNATSTGVGLSLNTNNVKIAYAANGLNGQTTSLASGFNFRDGDHTKATVDSNGVVKYNAKTSTISVANGHATASGNDLATADNVADAINQMTQNNAGNTTQLRQEISKVATETQRVGAHAAAMAALKPIQYDPLAPTQIMAGVGNYRGESAAALGIAHYTNDNTMFNVGVSVGGNHNMINAGVTHKFGISAEKKNIPDRYKAGPISSIYVMQDEMTQLRSENEAYKAKLDKQQSEIDALKAAVDQLLASKA